MKKRQTSFLVIFFISTMLIVSTQSLAQVPTPTASSNNTFFDKTLLQNFAVAIVSAILAFLSGYALSGLSRKQGSGKRISYNLSLEKGLVTVEKNVKDKVKVLYEGQEVDNLYHVKCDIENTGTTVVKSQYIRFEFPKGTDILDFSFDPVPEPEMKIEKISEAGLSPQEIKCRIGQIEREQRIGFRFTVTNSLDVELKLHPFNDSGDVEFSPRAVTKLANEQELITKFLTLYLMNILIPGIFNIIPNPLSDLIGGLVRLVLLIYLYPLIVPFSQAVAKIISKWSSENANKPIPTILQIEKVEAGGTVNVNQSN
jgi:hypothetical protein